MTQSVFVFDPTASDKLSAVRGIGRYLQILKENFPENTIFTDKIQQIPADSTFINPFFNFISPPLTMRRIAYKQIAVIHDLIPLKYPEHFPIGIRGNINVWLNKLALKNYDLIVTDSEASKHDIIRLLKIEEKKIKIIYPCLPNKFLNVKSQMLNVKSKCQNLKCNKKTLTDLTYGSNILHLTSNIGYCLYVGDSTWNKNLVNLAKAIKIIKVPCVFVGAIFKSPNAKTSAVEEERSDGKTAEVKLNNPWQKELYEFLELSKNDESFIFPGFLDDYRLIKLYEQAKVNVLVSRDEGFGFSYVEAGNFACPSVLSNISVLKELAGEGASFCDPNNPNDIADKIGEIYFNNDIRNKLALKAQEQSRKFNQKEFKKTWESFLL